MMGETRKIIFFDGVCGLCDHFITFMVDVDKKNRLKFATQQGKFFNSAEIQSLVSPEMGESIFYLKGAKIYFKSNAVLNALGDLGGMWSFIHLFKIIPGVFRDLIYDVIARNRYRIFGKREMCRIPTPEEKEKFIN